MSNMGLVGLHHMTDIIVFKCAVHGMTFPVCDEILELWAGIAPDFIKGTIFASVKIGPVFAPI